jgi:cobalamin synthase
MFVTAEDSITGNVLLNVPLVGLRLSMMIMLFEIRCYFLLNILVDAVCMLVWERYYGM